MSGTPGVYRGAPGNRPDPHHRADGGQWGNKIVLPLVAERSTLLPTPQEWRHCCVPGGSGTRKINAMRAETTDTRGRRCYTGDGLQSNYQDLKKWTKWVKSDMPCRKLERTQRGPFVYTLLQGLAREVADTLNSKTARWRKRGEKILELLLKR